MPGLVGLDKTGPQGLQATITIVEGLEQAFNWLVRELQRIAATIASIRKPNRGF